MIKPYYQTKLGQLFNCDCLEFMKTIPDKSIDLVLTDPPYGIGKAEWDKEYPLWLEDESFRIASTVCIMLAQWCIPQCIKQMGNNYKWMLAGHKPAAMTRGRIGFNKWLPAIVGGKIPNKGADAKDFHIGAKDEYNTGHPCQKPYQFVKWLVGLLSTDGNLIIDPFLGSGTTAVACELLNRRWIGIEISEDYCRIAKKRIEAEANQGKFKF